MTRTAAAIRHVAFEDLGLLGPVLREHGYQVVTVDAGIDDTVAPITSSDLVVVLGGPIGANDADRYPFLADELGALRDRVAAGRRTLGICLGAQLLARALGADVGPSGHTEIGYAPVTLSPEGRRSPLRHLAGTPVLHWHGDRFAIPAGAQRLAGTEKCDNQAFALGPNLLGLQFHLEVPPEAIERWLIGYVDSLSALGIEPAELRGAAAAAGAALTRAARAVIAEWLA
ncbi:MAG TPA: glutamine amidotransferase [Pseudonocardiaceae bacterium]|nr:glutamine amidotransferase [Pseudonocardiaceae bacterium]